MVHRLDRRLLPSTTAAPRSPALDGCLVAILLLLGGSAGCHPQGKGGGAGGGAQISSSAGSGAASSSSAAGAGGMGAGGMGGAQSSSGAGGASPGGGDLLWTKVFTIEPADALKDTLYPTAIATDAAGNIGVAGIFHTEPQEHLSFDKVAMLTSEPTYPTSGFLARLDGTGSALWATRFLQSFQEWAQDIPHLVFDPTGNIIAYGVVTGTVQSYGTAAEKYGAPWKNQSLCGQGGELGFAIEISPAGLAVDGAGDELFLEWYPMPQLAPPMILLEWSASCKQLWTKPMGLATNLAADGPGNIFLIGAAPATVMKLDPSGNPLWSKGWGQGQMFFHKESTDLLVDAAGDALVAAGFAGTVDFGGGPLASVGVVDFAIAKLDPSGSHLWSKHIGQAGTQIDSLRASLDGAGDLIVGGSSKGPIDLGDGVLPSGGFIAKFNASGALLWSKHIDSKSPATFRFAAAPDGSVIVTTASTSVDLGGGSPLTALQNTAAFMVAKLAP